MRLATYPDAIDGWRLLQYLEATKVGVLTFEGQKAPSDDLNALELLLQRMADAGVLEAIERPSKLFRPLARVNGGDG